MSCSINISSLLLLQAAAVLKTLASQVSQKNLKKDPITDGEVNGLECGLQTVLDSFKSLADFKHVHSGKVQLLEQLPVDESKVSALQTQMP